MSPAVLLAAATFAALGAAVVALATAVAGTTAVTVPPSGRRWQRDRSRLLAAVGAGLLVAVLTRWPVAALATAALIAGWRWLFGAAAAERAAVARLEALATWTESLRDTIAGAVGLEQAIPATAESAPAPIQPHLARLCGRLEARQPLPGALHELAADLDDPSADLVVAALLLNAGLRGPGLAATLTALAASAREELDWRRRVEAGRRGIRQGARIVAGTTVGFVALLAVANPGYLAPYGTPAGQLVLAVAAGVFTGGFAWLRRLSTGDAPARLLGPVVVEPATAGRWS